MLLSAESAAAISGPPSIDGISTSGSPDTYWVMADRKRREASDWASVLLSEKA
jgi:hypothetical protein